MPINRNSNWNRDNSFTDLQTKSKFAKPNTTRQKPRQLESSLQRSCVEWFKLQYPTLAKCLFSVPNGGSRNRIEAKRLKSEGVTPGVSDLILLVSSSNAEYHGLCIEMKTTSKSSKQRNSQKEFQAAVEPQGYKYTICRTLEGFIKEIKEYLEGVRTPAQQKTKTRLIHKRNKTKN